MPLAKPGKPIPEKATTVHPRKKAPPHTPVSSSAIINFFGYHKNQLTYAFQALAQSGNSPTITGGWPNVSNITRPRSIDYTVVTDYPPMSMDVPIRFENWAAYGDPVNANVEHDLQVLTWMWNRGKLSKSPHEGDPPIVKVAVFNPPHHAQSLTQSALIPPDVQDLEWIISNVSYDTAPLRYDKAMIAARGLVDVQVGDRGRQDVTVSLTQWIPAPGFRTKRAKPANGNISKKATVQYRNVQTMCSHYFDRTDPADWKTVKELPANAHWKLRSTRQNIPVGKKMWFPARFETATAG